MVISHCYVSLPECVSLQKANWWFQVLSDLHLGFLNPGNGWKMLEKRYWLVVSTHLKNISQIGLFPQVGLNIKTIWNHHPGYIYIYRYLSTKNMPKIGITKKSCLSKLLAKQKYPNLQWIELYSMVGLRSRDPEVSTAVSICSLNRWVGGRWYIITQARQGL